MISWIGVNMHVLIHSRSLAQVSAPSLAQSKDLAALRRQLVLRCVESKIGISQEVKGPGGR